jgi:hypothetical protein
VEAREIVRLGARRALATEIAGVAVYRLGILCAEHAPLRDEWRRYLEQTERHVEVMRRVLDALDLDPGSMTRGRAIVRDKGHALLAAMRRALKDAPGEAQTVAAECVLDAETKDHRNWEPIGELAEELDGEVARVLADAHSEVEPEGTSISSTSAAGAGRSRGRSSVSRRRRRPRSSSPRRRASARPLARRRRSAIAPRIAPPRGRSATDESTIRVQELLRCALATLVGSAAKPARILQSQQAIMDERAAIPYARVEPSVGSSLGRAFDAAQKLVVDELRLLQLESRETLQGVARRGTWLALGTFCLALAWLLLLAAAVVALEGRFPLETRLALVAGTQLVLGIALVGWGARRGDRS